MGFHNGLIHELRHENIEEYIRFLKMSPECFDEVLQLVEEDIQKQRTHLREPIPAKVKLMSLCFYMFT